MLSRKITGDFDPGRLKRLLVLFFLALAIPTGVLIWQAYSQLKWEAFHQYRGMAEELTGRIEAGLAERINTAEARTFADYTFLVVSGDPSANFVQRSALSALPVTPDVPGVIGYFQVGTEGEFSTPLLPQSQSEPATFGIDQAEYEQRLQLSRQIQSILSDNQLVQHAEAGLREERANTPASREGVYAADADREGAEQDQAYSQAVFDRLGQEKKNADKPFAEGRVDELKLDSALQKKSEVAEKFRQEEQARARPGASEPGRSKRKEQISLPESEPVQAEMAASEAVANLAASVDLRIRTFESEIDPLEFSLLDSGHFVLFRKVWRDAERYIQGQLIEQDLFLREAFGTPFQDTGLATVSNLIVAYQGEVLRTFAGGRYAEIPISSRDFSGDLLYRHRLSTPLNDLELIFSINGLPPGPGATVLAWVTLVLALVFLGGFYTAYRLGMSQINLARQQQDFVSAVSHELKTPLTSIRMYSEMLREGWADPAKQQQYYEYIHDESERLSRLISNVLQLAKITRNEPQFDLKPVPVGELMSRVQAKIAGQVQSAGFELGFDTDSRVGEVSIDIDEDCFTQIIINLIDNAIKFSREATDKRIEISCGPGPGNSVIFAIRDFGPGVPAGQMKKIFQLFYRSESELTRETVGTGIGLAIVHQLCLAMKGKVDVINRQPGAEFSLSFPAVAVS